MFQGFFHTGCISVRRLPTQDGIRDNEYERRCSSLTDEEYMQRALELAMRGAGWVNPNPLVGAVWYAMVELSAKAGIPLLANSMLSVRLLPIAANEVKPPKVQLST